MTKQEQIDESNEIIARAFEGGFFEAWAGKLWLRAERDAIRAAVREMLGARADGLKVRLDVKARDVYRDLDALPSGDWEQAKDARLVRVFVAEPRP